MSKKLIHGWDKLQARSSIMLLIVAAVIIEVMSVGQYIFTRNGIRHEVEQRARTEIKLKNMEIQNIISDVEVAVNNMQWLIDWAAANPDSIYSTLQLIIDNNPIITGCAMAFEPNHYPSKGEWYEPFAGLTAQGGQWTEPYFDDAGSMMMVSSYIMPIHDKNGKVIGVFCSDVSLEWLADLFGSNAGAYTFLTSRAGRLLACPDKRMVMTTTIQEVAKQFKDTMIDVVNANMLAGDSGDASIKDNDGNKNYMYYAPVEGKTGWKMAIIFPDKEIYAGLHRLGRQLVIFLILGLLLMAFILWRTFRGHQRLQAINAEKERIGNELRIASGIQMGMLPKTFPPYPDLDELAMAGSLVPAKEVGGDLFDFYVRDRKLFFCVGDVSGKGVPASLVMAVTRSLFRTVSSHTVEPDQVMKQMNNAMSEMNESSMFVTLFIGVLDLTTGTLSYSNAGHCPPVVIAGDEVASIDMDANIPVGLMTDWEYSRQTINIAPGSTIFVYTDGLTEAENAEHGQYGEGRMLAALKQNSKLAPKNLIASMNDSVHAFVAGAEQSDDLTMLAIHFITTVKA